MTVPPHVSTTVTAHAAARALDELLADAFFCARRSHPAAMHDITGECLACARHDRERPPVTRSTQWDFLTERHAAELRASGWAEDDVGDWYLRRTDGPDGASSYPAFLIRPARTGWPGEYDEIRTAEWQFGPNVQTLVRAGPDPVALIATPWPFAESVEP